jgi:hypothetical protein
MGPAGCLAQTSFLQLFANEKQHRLLSGASPATSFPLPIQSGMLWLDADLIIG